MNQLQESQLHQDVSPILGGASERPENIALLFDALPPFPRIFSFNGRIGRGAFFLIQIFLLLMLGAAVATYDGILSYGVQELLTIATPLVHGYANRELVSTFDLIGGGDELRIALAVLCFIAWYILGLSASVRRFHDFGYSGWTLVPLGLLSAIPYIGWLFGLMPYFVPGDEGPNQYGDPP